LDEEEADRLLTGVTDVLLPDVNQGDRVDHLLHSAAHDLFLAVMFISGVLESSADGRIDPDVGLGLVEAGDLDGALRFADELLAAADALSPDDWNYGNLIHDAHVIRGKAHLASGDLDLAAKELIAASETPGSPQLDTFGPDFSLAWALLLAGRDDEVLAYLRGVARFWEP
jgi:hypothetical protein